MSVTLIILDEELNPLPNGVELDLLSNGDVVATSTIEHDGEVFFNVGIAATDRLAVRLTPEDAPTPGS